MVRTRGDISFEQEFPLFHALISQDAVRVAALCTPEEVGKCGPGNLSPLMLALVLGADEHVPRLLAVGAPVDNHLTLSFKDADLYKWLAAAKLTVRREAKKCLVAWRNALDLALVLGKVEQACALVEAGAGLGRLLHDQSHSYGYYGNGGSSVQQQVVRHTLTHYSSARLAEAAAPLLGQVAQLALHAGEPDACMAALRAGVHRQVELSTGVASALLYRAAREGQPEVAMHLVEHSPSSLWGLLQQLDRSVHIHSSVAAVLFPHLAQQFSAGGLEASSDHLSLMARAALRAEQPAACLSMLRAAARRQPALFVSNVDALLRLAASKGLPEVVVHLLGAGANVWKLLVEQPASAYKPYSVAPSVAAVLFPHLAQQYAEGKLAVSDSSQLALLLRRASQAGQAAACLSLLCTAEERQLVLSEEHAYAVLRTAASVGQTGHGAVWWLLRPSYDVSLNVTAVLLPRLAQQCEAGELEVDSARLGLLVRRAAEAAQPAAGLVILQTALERQLELRSEDAAAALEFAVTQPDGAALVAALLTVSPAPDPAQAGWLAANAAAAGCADALELLLGAGAMVDAGMVDAAIRALSCPCLAVLLRHGPLPVHSVPVYTGGGFYSYKARPCLIRTLQVGALRGRCSNEATRDALDMIEMLVAAGHSLRVSDDMAVISGFPPEPAFDFIKDRPWEYDLNGVNRWPWLALQPGGWNPSTHHKHPLQMKRAFQAVLLAASAHRGSNEHAPQGPINTAAGEEAVSERQRLDLEARSASDGGAVNLLASLPHEVLLRVLHMAARPLSAWVSYDGQQ